MRAYQQTWEALKTKGEVSLVAPKNIHDRIHKAVRKEALLDKSFKDKVHSANGKFYISKAFLGKTLMLRLVWTRKCDIN